MTQYIDKAVVVEYINKVLNSYDPNEITSAKYALCDLRSFLDTIEVKEVDFWGNIEEVKEDKHWQDVRERAAIAALGGMLADTNMNAEVDLVAQISVNYADALVERLK